MLGVCCVGGVGGGEGRGRGSMGLGKGVWKGERSVVGGG